MQTYQSLPDLTGYKSKAAKRIARLAEEHAHKVTQLGALGRDLEQARQDLLDARARDTEVRALALRRGDEDPGRDHEQQARDHLEELQDKLRVHEQVVADVEADLSQTITEAKPELIAEARQKRAEAGERYTTAHRELREAHDAQRHHAGVVRWSLTSASHFSPPPPDQYVLSVPSTLPDDDPEQTADENDGTVRLVG
jgi:hypothetical protein